MYYRISAMMREAPSPSMQSLPFLPLMLLATGVSVHIVFQTIAQYNEKSDAGQWADAAGVLQVNVSLVFKCPI